MLLQAHSRDVSNILDSLNHRNVVRLIDKIMDKRKEKLYIVMEVSMRLALPTRQSSHP
jgi:serine/threonine protein kinase